MLHLDFLGSLTNIGYILPFFTCKLAVMMNCSLQVEVFLLPSVWWQELWAFSTQGGCVLCLPLVGAALHSIVSWPILSCASVPVIFQGDSETEWTDLRISIRRLQPVSERQENITLLSRTPLPKIILRGFSSRALHWFMGTGRTHCFELRKSPQAMHCRYR